MGYFWGLALFVFVFAGIFAQPTRSITDILTAKLTPTPAKKKSTKSADSVKKPAAKKAPTAQIQPAAKTIRTKPAPPKRSTEKEEFDKAWSIETPIEKIAALKYFLEKYPTSSRKNAVLELITVTRVQLGRERLKAAETADGVALLKAAVAEVPAPVADELFNSTLVKIPGELYFNGQRSEAVEIAGSLEDKIGGSPKQLLALAAFYLSIEGGSDAKRLAEKAVALDPTLTAGYQTLGLAARLNFDLDDAEKAYSKALDLEPDSLQSLRSLAELKRAQGRSEDAVGLYRRILEKDAANLPAETGLVLSLFDAGKRADAEAELSKSAEQNPNNVILLAGTAYWYAGHGEPDKAIEYAKSAIEKDPRYIWSHFALAAGLSAKKQPAAAEEVLLKARQYGNFPTLEYELAAVRLRSGFFRDAADELKKSFEIKDGTIRVKLGGRVEREGPDFVELLAAERRASTFEPESADDPETAARLKSLLELDSAVNAPEPKEEIVVKAADGFVSGSDNMRVHRALFAASSLLGKRIALPKVLEYTSSAIDGADDALDVADPGAAVMASELYDSRAIAIAREQLIKVPDVPRSTLSAILRGRIEETAGWALYYQNAPAEATVRLRRAVSVMPPKSAWWRSSMWKLGAALQADGKDAEALDSYIKSYSIDKPDLARYVTVEALYRKVHGNTEGIEAKIGANPQTVVPPSTETAVRKDPDPALTLTPDTAIKTDDTIATKTGPTPEPSRSPAAVPTPTPAAIVEVKPTLPPEITPKAITEVTATPAAQPTPTPVPEVVPTPTPAIDAAPTPVAETPPTPTPETSPSPFIQPTATPTA
ncbi:MAG: tetratricopeptide repeat protein, partial [Acidobacteriota bacterium]